MTSARPSLLQPTTNRAGPCERHSDRRHTVAGYLRPWRDCRTIRARLPVRSLDAPRTTAFALWRTTTTLAAVRSFVHACGRHSRLHESNDEMIKRAWVHAMVKEVEVNAYMMSFRKWAHRETTTIQFRGEEKTAIEKETMVQCRQTTVTSDMSN
jgi:hypothetical protein